MTERKEQILEYVIMEYIRTAQPVSSFQLIKQYDLPYSSATIRNELNELEHEGYLGQLHTSSGRVPTDRGYRHYVNRLLARQELLRQYASVAHKLMDDLNRMNEIHIQLKQLLTSIAQESQGLAIGKLSSDVIFQEGMNQFLSQPYFSSMEFIHEALKDLEDVQHHIDEIGQGITPGGYELYIGEENPIQPMQKYSVIVGRCDFDGDDGTIVMIGPKSMQYAKNIALIEYVLNPDNETYDEQE